MNKTLGEVAEHAGVAVDTARKVLREDASVRPYIRERVLRAIAELDYRPNLVARALRDRSLRLVPISVLDLDQFYFGGLASQLSRCLVDAGLEPALCFNPDHLMRLNRSLSTSASILVTGLDGPTILALSQRQKVATINSCLPDMPNVGDVAIDFTGAFREAVRLLLRRGRRQIAYCSAHHVRCIVEGWDDPKFRSALTAMREAGLEFVASPAAHPVFGKPEELAAWLAVHPGAIDSVLCENDITAAHLLGQLAARGMRTPDDVLIVGCDANCVLAGAWSIKLDTAYLASQAVGLLLRLLDGATSVDRPVYVPKVVDDAGAEVSSERRTVNSEQ
jgi:DNA-binding LacI/PurR family transcriptional regulator